MQDVVTSTIATAFVYFRYWINGVYGNCQHLRAQTYAAM